MSRFEVWLAAALGAIIASALFHSVTIGTVFDSMWFSANALIIHWYFNRKKV